MRLGGIHGLCVVGSLGREDKVTWFSESRRDKERRWWLGSCFPQALGNQVREALAQGHRSRLCFVSLCNWGQSSADLAQSEI